MTIITLPITALAACAREIASAIGRGPNDEENIESWVYSVLLSHRLISIESAISIARKYATEYSKSSTSAGDYHHAKTVAANSIAAAIEKEFSAAPPSATENSKCTCDRTKLEKGVHFNGCPEVEENRPQCGT